MNSNNKNKNTYTKEKLIKTIAGECKKDLASVRSMYNALEKVIFELLSSADIDNDICIKLFEGVSINSTFIPEKSKVNNLTGEEIIATSKVKPKVNITRNYCEKLTSHNK